MIKWNCNFNIPDSAIQLSGAYVNVTSYKNINDSSVVDISITDETGFVTVKQYSETFQRSFANVEEIYQELLYKFDNAELVL
jgi:hypothetical protein